jgi:hypothetical protein
VIQWFRGELEASYVGSPNAQPYFGTRSSATHYKLTVYRAALKNLAQIEPPTPEARAALGANAFHQARVDDALIAGVRGPGSRYQGPVFELQVSEPVFSHAVQKDGRAYGRLTGHAILYCDLPPEPEQPVVETSLVTADRGEAAGRPEPLRAELRTETNSTSASTVTAPSQPAQTSMKQTASERATADAEPTRAAPSTAADEKAPTRAVSPRTDSAAPLFALAAAVALGLWASCGALPALLWCLFLAPTLIARKLFHGVLNDSPYIRGFGALLAIGQLLCVSTLVSEWWSVPCKELHVLPLIGIVAVIFPAGVLPSVLPLVFNAAGLALVLSVWCSGANSACIKTRATPSSFAPASVEHPGVPRTNQDGTWPRRPPGR